jgi:hypothetical protein
MANNRQTLLGRKKIQIIYSEPRLILKESYITKKGNNLRNALNNEGLSSRSKEYKQRLAEINAKYVKNRYVFNPKAMPVKTIIHPIV